ncbi:MAG TPA: OadG family transporter subunit [Pseudomonas sp.]|nr:OadG family transporter subunit [Pseudomonas sp.]
MTPTDLLMEGVELMLIGIGSVYVFLTLLVYAIRGMSVLIARFAPEPMPPVATAQIPRPQTTAPADVSPDLIAAIQAAIHQHRNKRR